uniref:Cytochrome c biogenesis B n=1 Tax=Cunninghamia lanceolata TaxID=28977 RepID=A0A8F4RHG5_CUNLA|nr:cytochrome c biogenesis B [Cunninghamia lanceolata]BDG69833.1 cytochrome c biogenesis B [Cunninghamia lanceolata var. konishii]
MRRLFIGLFHKRILLHLPTLITSSSPSPSYIVVTPFITGSEKDFSCHFHSGPIRIPPPFSLPPEPFFRSDKEDGTLESYPSSTYCSPGIPLPQLVGHRVLRISRVFRSFPILQLPYQFDRFGMNWFNILLGSPILTLMCGIHSRLALGIPSSGWNSSQNSTTLPTLSPPIVFRTSIETEWFHVPSSIGYSPPFASPFPISVSMGPRDSMASSN